MLKMCVIHSFIDLYTYDTLITNVYSFVLQCILCNLYVYYLMCVKPTHQMIDAVLLAVCVYLFQLIIYNSNVCSSTVLIYIYFIYI